MTEQVNIPLWINEIVAEMEKADADRRAVLQGRMDHLYTILPPAKGVFEVNLRSAFVR